MRVTRPTVRLEVCNMFRILTWNFSGTAEPVVAGLLLGTLLIALVLI